MSIETLEKRVSELEKEMQWLRAQRQETAADESGSDGPRGVTSPDWLRRVSGMFANEPLFDEMTKAVQEARETERAALPSSTDAPK